MKNLRSIGKVKKQAMFLLICLVILMFGLVGCGKKKENTSGASQIPESTGQEISIYYHADDGELETGWAPSQESETIQKNEKEKTVIRFETPGFQGRSMYQRAVDMFNAENDQYFVDLHTCNFGDELGDRRMTVKIEISAGGGPDILVDNIFHADNEMLEKGVLLDLSPYLEESGITSDKYFPQYKGIVYKDKIYGVLPSGSVSGYAIKKAVLGTDEVPDMESFVDKLLAYPEKAGFRKKNFDGDGWRIVKWLLDGSENLWGVVDWEKRQCDFSLPIFSKILDVGKRYAADGIQEYEPILKVLSWKIGMDPEIDSEWVYLGYPFDAGYYPMFDNLDSLMINANSKNIEGAFAFISYVMSKKGQNYMTDSVHREFWESNANYQISLSQSGRTNYVFNEEIKERIKEQNDLCHLIPRRPEAILNIVYEEVNDYIFGNKTKEAVIEIIQNRVQLYLDEL